MADEFKNRLMLSALSGRKKADVLDLGCGPGDYSRFLIERGFNVFSVDLSKPTGNALPEFSVADAVRLPFKDGSFDLVVGFDVFEHIPDAEAAFSEVKRVLRDGGRVLASVPNDSIISRLYFKLTLRQPPSRADPTHVRFLRFSKWRSLFCRHFHVMSVSGQLFTEGGSALKRLANAFISRLYYFTPNIYFLLGR